MDFPSAYPWIIIKNTDNWIYLPAFIHLTIVASSMVEDRLGIMIWMADVTLLQCKALFVCDYIGHLGLEPYQSGQACWLNSQIDS